MPRPETSLDVEAGELPRFAQGLRELRRRAGGLTYRAMAKKANYSATVLSEAAGGRRLPTLAVTLAYVQACGGDRGEWRARWHAVADETAEDNAKTEQVPPRFLRSRRLAIGVASALAALAALAVLVVALVRQSEPVMPEHLATEKSDAPAGNAETGSPPSGLPCSVHAQARACIDKLRGVVWVKDLPPSDGHHAAIYWTTTDGEAQGDCHNYLKADGPWVTCAYSNSSRSTVGFRVAVVEEKKVLEWGPHIQLSAD